MKKVSNWWLSPARRNLLAAWLAGLVIGALFISGFIHATGRFSRCQFDSDSFDDADTAAPIQMRAILHYATSREVPQQTEEEIQVSLHVLSQRGSLVNFLIFGLGRDSLMWAAFNHRGTTLFLEEDPKWVQSVLTTAPELQARTLQYRTRLSEAEELLRSYKSEPACLPPSPGLEGNGRCRLALSEMPKEVYEKEWDLIMIDGPRGFFPEAPGRMAAIYSAGLMARNRRGEGVTHVFLHDVNRRVERAFAEEFLCEKYRVKAVGRLWHFEIPPARNWKEGDSFC